MFCYKDITLCDSQISQQLLNLVAKHQNSVNSKNPHMYSWKIIHGKNKRIALQSLINPIELIIQDCVFDSNYANYRSGAVFMKTTANQLLMTNDLQLQSNSSQSWDNGLAFNGLVVKIKILASNFTKKSWWSTVL